MILMAGMTVPGDVPKEGMGEIEERLDLHGEWEGVMIRRKEILPVRYAEGEIIFTLKPGHVSMVRATFTEVGPGRLTVGVGQMLQAIYHTSEDRNRVTICISLKGDASPPSSFKANHEQQLLILHRVKSTKPSPVQQPPVKLQPLK